LPTLKSIGCCIWRPTKLLKLANIFSVLFQLETAADVRRSSTTLRASDSDVRRQSLRPNLRQQPPQNYSALAQQSDDNSGDESPFEIRKLFTTSWHCILFALLSAVFPFETTLRKARLFQ
jgi:hypothetical protein